MPCCKDINIDTRDSKHESARFLFIDLMYHTNNIIPVSIANIE